jgi:hypothetical protein
MTEELRPLMCNHCHKYIAITSNPDVVAYCDSVCDNSHVIEESAESKDEMLRSIMYADSRDDFVANHEVSIEKGGE